MLVMVHSTSKHKRAMQQVAVPTVHEFQQVDTMVVIKSSIIEKYSKVIVLLLFTMLSGLGIAQLQGPAVPCIDCEGYTKRVEPYNGAWYNPQQSGSGYSIEVQKGKVFGIYFGYNAEGKTLWLTFVGDLMPSEEAGIMWTLDADLTKMQNGNCINCDYQAPEAADFQSTIHIDFKQINYASVSVNDGSVQNMIPLNYRFASNADFPELTDYKLPDLKGMWVFSFHTNWEALLPYLGFGNQWAFYSKALYIGRKSPLRDLDNDGNQEIWYSVHWYIMGTPEIYPYGAIKCEEQEVDGVKEGPMCVFIDAQGIFGVIGETRYYHFSLGGLGMKRIFGQTTDGHTFEAIKVDSTDYISR